MCLRRFTDSRPARRLALPVAMLVLAGCAGSPQRAEVPAEPVPGVAGLPVVPPEALTMFEQAVAVMAGGDFVEAELRLKEFVMRYPGFAAARVNLAIIHAANGDDEAAQAEIDAALAIDPDYAPALNQQGLLFRRNGKFLDAEAAYLKAVTVSPEYALAHYNLGVLNELYLQRLEEALRHFERYQELAGNDEQVQKWIADLERRVAANQRTANVAE